MSNLNIYKSHPNKSLLTHIDGVKNHIQLLSNSDDAGLVATFHDLGKMNPFFQKKLSNSNTQGYDRHSYLSAFALMCYLVADDKYTDNDIVGLCAIVAKHHGNLPDFQPKQGATNILNTNEITHDLFPLLDKYNIPIDDYVTHFTNNNSCSQLSCMPEIRELFLSIPDDKLFKDEENIEPINYYLKIQNLFASLLLADKTDAACLDDFIIKNAGQVEKFANVFSKCLNNKLENLPQDTALNILRTKIRCNAVDNIKKELPNGDRVFELTAPTGSGKTLMLLSLASEIIKQKGPKRIIYSLPFLSITEQVEKEVLSIFKGHEENIQRIDSKSTNTLFESLQKKIEDDPKEEYYKKMNVLDFKEQTFSYPFVITTFVRFFETLLSNKNSELLKLPNFSNSIFLIDEIQTLPPRLYTFFAAYLTVFCKKYNSYAILSTATQPNFELTSKSGYVGNAIDFFPEYKKPVALLPSYFDNELFNRYIIKYREESVTLSELADEITNIKESCLVILNTIDDSLNLYNAIKNCIDAEVVLLNTHFTPSDRKSKIADVKRYLENNKQVILISTQLIEAGVDIDFPVVYRDLAITSSIIQSAGRCNRNGKLDHKGIVNLIKIIKEGKLRANLIYRDQDADLLRFTKESFTKNEYDETELLSVQQLYFNKINSDLNFGQYNVKDRNGKYRFLLPDIKNAMFETIGQFSLIEKDFYGEERQYYVKEREDDQKFDKLIELREDLIYSLKNNDNLSVIKIKKIAIEQHLKKMSNNTVQVRIRRQDTPPTPLNEDEVYNLWLIDRDNSSYSKDTGINMVDCIL